MYPGWKDFKPFFKFTCERHGEQVSYEHGYRKRLICPICEKEKTEVD